MSDNVVTFVAGACPACGARALAVDQSGALTCLEQECPRPTALAELLELEQGPRHIVELDEDAHAVQHPMVERLDEGVFTCGLYQWLTLQPGSPKPPGRYVVTGLLLNELQWDPIP
jgi:hypothetical protein